MKTLGRICGYLMLAEGTAVTSLTRDYIRFWDREGWPRWLRDLAHPWLALPEGTLRLVGVGEALTGALMIGLAERAR